MPTRYVTGKSFDPATADLMREAFESAWKSLQDCGDVDVAVDGAEWTRDERGERDLARLRSDAISHLANAKRQRKA